MPNVRTDVDAGAQSLDFGTMNLSLPRQSSGYAKDQNKIAYVDLTIINEAATLAILFAGNSSMHDFFRVIEKMHSGRDRVAISHNFAEAKAQDSPFHCPGEVIKNAAYHLKNPCEPVAGSVET